MKKYDPRVTPRQIKEHEFPQDRDPTEKLQFLLRYAILAPSSHNTQPWKFSVGKDEIQVFIDRTRWLKVADPDLREQHISVGCALENLLIAAEHFGYGHQVTYFPKPANEELVATVKLKPQGQPTPFRDPALFEAILNRRTNRKVYDERPIPQGDLQHLQNCCVEGDIWLHMTDDLETKRKADELIIRGDAIQFSDPAFREELGYWIGQGLLSAPWLMSKMAQLTVTYMNLSKGQAKKDSEVLMSAPILAAISSEVNDRESQVKVGQVFERVCLAATIRGIRVHPMSQILEIPELKAEVSKLIPKPDVFPQHTFRLGYIEQEKEHTPRRPLEEVLV
ncbi:Nitroreductase [Methanophagales archaeon]|nr:Nitroreductase [Methanophagales archaeon]